MGLIEQVFSLVFGGGRNAVVETVEVFRENAEAGARRDSDARHQSLVQFAAEFNIPERSGFDRVMDGVNRLPRPALALGTFSLFVAAMTDPVWFAARMQGLALVPEPLWWLLGVVVSFYFGARHQAKSQEFQRDLATTLARTPNVVETLSQLQNMHADTPGSVEQPSDPDPTLDAQTADDNPALDVWRSKRRA